MPNKIERIRNGFLYRNSTAIMWSAIAISVIAFQGKRLNAMTDFISEKDLWNEFRPGDAA